MIIEQYEFKKFENLESVVKNLKLVPNLVLIFGDRIDMEDDQSFIKQIKNSYPLADIITVSSAGTIHGNKLISEFSATFIELEKTKHLAKLFNYEMTDSEFQLGIDIVESFDKEKLNNILLFGTTGINAEKVLDSVNENLPKSITVSGGIAGDNDRFEKTLVGLNDNINEAQLVAIGFYGDRFEVSHGSKGGWETYGDQMRVTKSEGNILYEIDHKPALQLYKDLLGEKSNELPAAALLFPFTILNESNQVPIVRTIQSIDEDSQSLVLFGDVHTDDRIQLMKADFENLINGAAESAAESKKNLATNTEFALLISCVGRKLVLGDQTVKEIEIAQKGLGESTKICGFYSYSELSPVVGDNSCLLHNQTMTITTFSEN